MTSQHMHCIVIWGLTCIYLKQKLTIEVLLHHLPPNSSSREKLKIPTLLEIKPGTTTCEAVTLPLCHSGGQTQWYYCKGMSAFKPEFHRIFQIIIIVRIFISKKNVHAKIRYGTQSLKTQNYN